MKKFLTIALCFAAACSMCAQKAVVDQAKKLSGKIDKIEEARNLIKQAAANPETANDVNTYFIGGKIEFDAYDNARKKMMINPDDKDVNPMAMAYNIINGYDMYMKALPLDSVPNEKGEVKAKNSKNIISALQNHFNDYYQAGGTFYNEKKYYPEAYKAFMAYGCFPSSPYTNKAISSVPDSVINMALFYAGLSGYAGNKLPEAAKAFKKARLQGYDNPQNYIYEIACWQNMAMNDSTLQEAAKTEIEQVAAAGYQKFGMSQPLFFNNLINSYVQEDRGQEAIELINGQIEKTPDNASIYGLRGYVYDRLNNDDASVADYRKAASFENADFETLKNAAKKLFKEGTVKWDGIERSNPDARRDVMENYFIAAKNIATRAKALNSSDSDIDYVLDNINYALETYFPSGK